MEKKVLRRLREGMYPERSILHLGKMHGPGLEAAQAVAPRLYKGGLVFLIGDRGPGKTQAATWIASQRIRDGNFCGRYVKALDLWSAVRGTWRAGAEKSEEDAVSVFRKVPFLVIDEAQERGDTESDRQWCDRLLTHIIDHRYDAMLDTLLIANLTKDMYEKTIPSSIRSRVVECGGVKVCDWPSYRT